MLNLFSSRTLLRFCAAGLACLPLAAAADLLTSTNQYLSVVMEREGFNAGQFGVMTGASHPQPNKPLFFMDVAEGLTGATSYLTLRDNTAQEVWTNAGGTVSDHIAPYTAMNMQEDPTKVSVTAIAGGFRSVYTLPNWVVTQDVVVEGSTAANSVVVQRVTVRNTSAGSRSFGLRFLWDWHIGGNDAVAFRPRSPDGAPTATFAVFDAPAFGAFEQLDNATAPVLRAYGSVTGGSLAPTPPDRVGYVDWWVFSGAPWDAPVSGGNMDSATVHYWGLGTPLSIAAGAQATFVAYIATDIGALGLGAVNPNPPLPQAPPTADAIEYLHAEWGHYFVTHRADELAALDNQVLKGWTRTGRSFKVYSATNGLVRGVCRYFTNAPQFLPKGSHFYSAIPNECQVLLANPDWTFEAAEVFWAEPANVDNGSCPTGTKPVYRLYNEGQTGAPNHRYTTEPSVRAEMMAKGWTPEGFGAEGVGFCSPP